MIKIDTFFRMLERIYPNRKLHPKQIDFLKFALNEVNTDRDTDKITVFPARCGLGKSTYFLKVLVKSWLAENTDEGLIIVTDNLERLAVLDDVDDNRIAFLTAENKATEIFRQNYCPVLLISTQRYFQMDSIEPFLTYRVNGKAYKRKTVIFDESPYFRKNTEIGIDHLNLLHSALNEGITDLCNADDKKWALEQYDTFRNKMIDIINGLEQRRNQTTYLYYSPEFDHITDDDTRFLTIVESFAEINSKYPKARQIVSDLLCLVENGGFFSSSKLRDNNTYHKGFIVTHDYREKFMLGKDIKTFIFDATANISELYPYDAEWLKILNCDDFTVPLDFMKVHLININTSRNSLINQSDRGSRLAAIKGYLKRLSLDVDDSLFITYKTLLENDIFRDLGFTTDNALYFGNTKGFNSEKDKHTLVQVGLNRQTGINYLLNFLSNNEDFSMRVKYDIRDVDLNIAELDNLMKSDIVDSYTCAEITADLVQNIFRTKARDLNNRDRIDVYLFCRATDNLKIELKYALERFGATVEVEGFECFQEEKIKRRKGDSVAKRILTWLDEQSNNREFIIEEMLSEVGIEAKNFKIAKKNNSFLKDKFDRMKMPNTRGKYKVC